jgi:hypothetical protein
MHRLAASLVVALLALAGCGCEHRTRTSSPGASSGVSARSCVPGRLRLTVIRNHGITQDAGIGIVVGAGSAGTCVLSGTAAANARLSDGRWLKVPDDQNASYLPPGAGWVQVSAKAQAILQIYVPAQCASGINQGPPYYVTVSLRIAGVVRTLNGLNLPARCGPILVSPYYYDGPPPS